jgi:hypothetical protein
MDERTYLREETDRASLPESSGERSLDPPATPKPAPPLLPLLKAGHMPPNHPLLPEPSRPLLPAKALPVPTPTCPTDPLPNRTRLPAGTRNPNPDPTLDKEEISRRTIPRKGPNTYCMDRATESITTARSGGDSCTSPHDDRTPHMRNNDLARNASRHRQGRGARNS